MKLFQYEHCPYCVRPRLAAAINNINLKIIDLVYDDVQTPMNMIGKKLAPILQKEDLSFMPESIDICSYLDALDGKSIIQSKKANKNFDQLMDKLHYYIRYLTYPRLYHHPQNKGVFPTDSAISYFKVPKEEKMAIDFDYALKHSDLYIADTENLLSQVMPFFEQRIVDASNGVSNFLLSYDDIEFFPLLRLLTLAVDVIKLPEPILIYLEKLSEISKVKLYAPFDYAC
ncbi:MAG: glutaredoxin 2 [Gammaproteobacteria bacterium]|nr:MAG: glutaredoxin 2 [Gammaproteobacteria bacterium]UTW42261.1 glutaredoxin 2 [bacterium SCSIO 12844]